jgi:5-oxopent-3-ene-1,2,5-tricarboxylate decarboxylase / 2-hydroxyhepta-2,4-diene-1,7-dioate isomerase
MQLTIDHALLRLEGRLPCDMPVDPQTDSVRVDGVLHQAGTLAWLPPVTGTVYGALLNFRGAVAALGDAVNQPPYKAPPRAPILYIKPRNTFSAHRRAIVVPAGVDALEIGATVGVVIGRTACRLHADDALDAVAGYTVANDVSVPHPDYYRPSVRYKCRDGFLPIGPWVLAARHVPRPDALEIRVVIDGKPRLHASLRDLVRPIATLLVDVTEFMTLVPGDVLLVGVPAGAPRARPGQQVAITVDGVGTLENTIVAAPAAGNA